MLIKTIEDFRKLCKRWEDAFADSFDESRLISKIGKVTKYATFYRDESNNKCIAVLMWDPCTRHADLEAEYPEAHSAFANLLQEFEHPMHRKFIVFLKVEVKARSLEEAISKAQARVQQRKGMHGFAYPDARSAQF